MKIYVYRFANNYRINSTVRYTAAQIKAEEAQHGKLIAKEIRSL